MQPLRYLQVSPAQYVKLPSTRAVAAVRTRSAPHVYITSEQMGLIFKRFPEGSSSYLPLLLGYKCGLWIGETFGLTWDCIDLDAKTLTVNKRMLWHERVRKTSAAGYWYFSAPKYNSARTIEISADVANALTRKKACQDKAPALLRRALHPQLSG